MTPRLSMTHFTLAELAEKLGAECVGDANLKISGVASLSAANNTQIAFFENPKLASELEKTAAAAILINPKLSQYCKTPCLIVEKPRLAFITLLNLFYPSKTTANIHPSVIIGEHCQIDPSVSIGANVVIGDHVAIGANTKIYPNVTIYNNVKIGARVILHSGVVLGADGFGYERDTNAAWVKVPQIGGVEIGNDVEIGANTTVDSGALDPTVIGNGVKIDNLVMIGHNVRIGDHSLIAGCSGIAGSTQLGKYCIVGGSAMIADHLKITDNVVLAGAAMVGRSVDEPGIYYSFSELLPPAQMKRLTVRFNQLDEMAKRIAKLENL